MAAWLKRQPVDVRVDGEGGKAAPQEMTDETRKQLEALGYL